MFDNLRLPTFLVIFNTCIISHYPPNWEDLIQIVLLIIVNNWSKIKWPFHCHLCAPPSSCLCWNWIPLFSVKYSVSGNLLSVAFIHYDTYNPININSTKCTKNAVGCEWLYITYTWKIATLPVPNLDIKLWYPITAHHNSALHVQSRVFFCQSVLINSTI